MKNEEAAVQNKVNELMQKCEQDPSFSSEVCDKVADYLASFSSLESNS